MCLPYYVIFETIKERDLLTAELPCTGFGTWGNGNEKRSSLSSNNYYLYYNYLHAHRDFILLWFDKTELSQ